MPKFFQHPSSDVSKKAVIGAGTKIWHFSHVSADVQIGSNCVLGQNVFVAPGVQIGNGVKIQNNVSLYAGVTLEDDVFCGPSCVFTNVKNPRSHVSRKSEFLETRVGKGATLGANSTIVCGAKIGSYAFIGAGAVVTGDIPDHALVVGVPARPKGWVCVCGEILKFKGPKAKCLRCSCQYIKKGNKIETIR